MKYFEITKESPAYEAIKKLWSYKESWRKADKEIKQLIGCDTNENLYYNPDRLCLNIVPEHLKNQFLKNKWYYGKAFVAKKSSDIQSKFVEIIKKHGVFTESTSNVADILGTFLQGGKESYYPPMNKKYYLQTEREIKQLKGIIEIPEPDFLRLRADWLEEAGEQS